MSSSACPYPQGLSLEVFVGFKMAKAPLISVAICHPLLVPIHGEGAWKFFLGFKVSKVPLISVAMFHGVIEPVSTGCAWKFWWHMWDDKASPILVLRKHF